MTTLAKQIPTRVMIRALREQNVFCKRQYVRQLRKISRSLKRCGGEAAAHGVQIGRSARSLQAAV